MGTRDAVASLEDITAKGPLTLKNVIVLLLSTAIQASLTGCVAN